MSTLFKISSYFIGISTKHLSGIYKIRVLHPGSAGVCKRLLSRQPAGHQSDIPGFCYMCVRVSAKF